MSEIKARFSPNTKIQVCCDAESSRYGLVMGGEVDGLTLGVTWHLNPNVRIMVNVVFADVTGGPEGRGKLTAVKIRFQIDF